MLDLLRVHGEAESRGLLDDTAMHERQEREHGVVAKPTRLAAKFFVQVRILAFAEQPPRVCAERAWTNQYRSGDRLAGHREQLECERPGRNSQGEDVLVPVPGHLDPSNPGDARVAERAHDFLDGAGLKLAV